MVNLFGKVVHNMPSARVGAGSFRVMKFIALVFLPLTLLLLENASAETPLLVFSSNAQVTSSKVYLSDILVSAKRNKLLEQKLKNIIVVSAPIPGKIKIIKRPQIVRTLTKHKLTTDDTKIFIPEKITVTRKSLVYDRKQIESVIRDELLKKNFIDKKNTAFTISDIQKDVILPTGHVKTIVKMPGKIKYENKFWVLFYMNGRLKNRIWAKGTIKRNIEVLAANNRITANNIISEDDLTYVKRNLLELGGNYFTNKRAIIGKRAKINISGGRIFTKESLGEENIVKAGDMVNIIAKMKNMTISASGKVISPKGDIGETVTVLNVDSKEKLKAVVLNKKTVEVEVH